jgi:hypothetical protein
MTPFRWTGEAVAVSLDHEERSLLASLPALLEGVGSARHDPAARRLNPAAYRSDKAAADEYRRLMSGEMDRARADDRDLFAESLGDGSVSITVADAEAWLRVLGDARLALAARRGIVEGGDEWEHRIESDPDLALVAWLGFLQAMLVDALDEALAAP